MASTIVEFIAYAGQSLTAVMRATPDATGSPAASYACSEVYDGQYRFAVPEALVGEFYVEVKDGSGTLALLQFVEMADDTAVHICYDYNGLDVSVISDSIASILASTAHLTAGLAPPARQKNNTIFFSVGERQNKTVTVDSDLTGLTLAVVFEIPGSKVDVAYITSGIVITSNSVTFPVPEAVTAVPRRLDYSIRDTASDASKFDGTAIIKRAGAKG